MAQRKVVGGGAACEMNMNVSPVSNAKATDTGASDPAKRQMKRSVPARKNKLA